MLLHSTLSQTDINRNCAFACRKHLIIIFLSAWPPQLLFWLKNWKKTAIKKETYNSLHLKQNLYTASVGHKPQSAYTTCNFYTAIVGYLKCHIIRSPCMLLLCSTWDTAFLRDTENSWKKRLLRLMCVNRTSYA